MFRYVVAIAWIGVSICMVPASAELASKKLEIEAGDKDCCYVPVTLAVGATETAASPVVVKNVGTGIQYPATLRNGSLVFVVDALKAKTLAAAEITAVEKPENAQPRVNITKRDGEAMLDVQIDGVLFTSYHYGDQWRKPFLWPVNSEGGVGVTRDFPMEVESTPRIARDHPHHKSLWTSYGEVNGKDFWGEGTDAGNQRSKEVTFGSGDAYGWIRSVNVWETQEGEPIIDETREYRFYATPEKARLLDVFVLFKASQGEVLFSDTKEGGIVAVRMRPDICHARAVITNALGDQGEGQAWGKPSPWCDFSGDVPDVGWRGLAIFDHPENLRHPSCWHVRNYGLMGANAFGYSYFVEKAYNKGLIPENGDYTLAAGEELTFNYRVYVHSGNVEEAAVGDRYQEYTTPPSARFVE